MSTLAEIEAAAESLPPDQQEQLLAFLQSRLGRNGNLEGGVAPISSRRAGMHAGIWDVSADFDAPFVDDFWLGRDA